MAIHIGIKVWAHNTVYIPHVQELYKKGLCDFAEIYVGIKTPQENAGLWQNLVMPLRLHAPHSLGGFNPALKEQMESKEDALRLVDIFRESLAPSSIVFHAGTEGSLQESVRQFKLFKQQFPEIFKVALIENKPHVGLKQEPCRGDSLEEIQELMREIGFGFCLDFGHAACYAAWAKREWQQVIKAFMTLQPQLFHLSDGDIHSVVDMHQHLGAGNFPLRDMLAFLSKESYVTLETPHDSQDHLDDFSKDVDMVRRLLR